MGNNLDSGSRIIDNTNISKKDDLNVENNLCQSDDRQKTDKPNTGRNLTEPNSCIEMGRSRIKVTNQTVDKPNTKRYIAKRNTKQNLDERNIVNNVLGETNTKQNIVESHAQHSQEEPNIEQSIDELNTKVQIKYEKNMKQKIYEPNVEQQNMDEPNLKQQIIMDERNAEQNMDERNAEQNMDESHAKQNGDKQNAISNRAKKTRKRKKWKKVVIGKRITWKSSTPLYYKYDNPTIVNDLFERVKYYEPEIQSSEFNRIAEIPPEAFVLFVHSQLGNIGKTKRSVFVKKVVMKWLKLSDDERKVFFDEAEAEKERHKVDRAKFVEKCEMESKIKAELKLTELRRKRLEAVGGRIWLLPFLK